MIKFSLNRYETFLLNQPEDRVFGDPRIQRAHANLMAAKNYRNSYEMASLLNSGQDFSKNEIDLARKMQSSIQKNRGNVFKGNKVEVKSPFSTRKNLKGNAVTNDVLAENASSNLISKKINSKKLETNSISNKKLQAREALEKGLKKLEPKSNKFLNYIKNKPGKSALIGAGVLGGIGLIGYGLKKSKNDE